MTLSKKEIRKIILAHLRNGGGQVHHFRFTISNLVAVVWQSQPEKYRTLHAGSLPKTERELIAEVVWDLVSKRVATPDFENPGREFFLNDGDMMHMLDETLWGDM